MITSYKIKKYYGYPTFANNIYIKYNAWDNTGVEEVKTFFEEILKTAEEKTSKRLEDNKIAFELELENNDIIYCGMKDDIYYLSKNIWTETTRILDIK